MVMGSLLAIVFADHLVVTRVIGEACAAAPAGEVRAVRLAGLKYVGHGGSPQGVCCVDLKVVPGERGDQAVRGAEELVGGMRERVVFAEAVSVHEGGPSGARLERAFRQTQGAHAARAGEGVGVEGRSGCDDEASEVPLLRDACGVDGALGRVSGECEVLEGGQDDLLLDIVGLGLLRGGPSDTLSHTCFIRRLRNQ
jgi:hypothetical protein